MSPSTPPHQPSSCPSSTSHLPWSRFPPSSGLACHLPRASLSTFLAHTHIRPFPISTLIFIHPSGTLSRLSARQLPLTPVSFAGVGFLSLYLAGKMHLWDVYGNRVSVQPPTVNLTCLCFVFADARTAPGSPSRRSSSARWLPSRARRTTAVSSPCSLVKLTPDHWQDVLVGSLLGMCVGKSSLLVCKSKLTEATIAYRTYYRKSSVDFLVLHPTEPSPPRTPDLSPPHAPPCRLRRPRRGRRQPRDGCAPAQRPAGHSSAERGGGRVAPHLVVVMSRVGVARKRGLSRVRDEEEVCSTVSQFSATIIRSTGMNTGDQVAGPPENPRSPISLKYRRARAAKHSPRDCNDVRECLTLALVASRDWTWLFLEFNEYRAVKPLRPDLPRVRP